MSDRYLEHCMAVLRRSKEEAEDGVSCILSVPEVDCIIDLLKRQGSKRMWLCNGELCCPQCGAICKSYYHYCNECGQAVKWE